VLGVNDVVTVGGAFEIVSVADRALKSSGLSHDTVAVTGPWAAKE
jgi:6,7-dimethyl-8-ribityllumazine synthase